MRPRNKTVEGHRNWSPVETTTEERASVFDDRPDRDWLNPNSMSALKRAVEKKAKTVTLNGNKFDIIYGIIWEYKLSDDRECIKLKRSDGSFAPFGYVSLKKILDFEYEGHHG